MSVTYILHIKRKSDDKELCTFVMNQLKNIVGSEFEDILHLSSYGSNGRKFTMSDIECFNMTVWNKINEKHNEIFEKKLLIACAHSVDIKNELEEDIFEIQRYIDEELRWAAQAGAALTEAIELLVEDLENKDGVSAYIYNAADLPKQVYKQHSGTEIESEANIFSGDVYCEVEVA